MIEQKVNILILNWNCRDVLKNCLSSIFKITDYPNYKVIVVDNGSTDDSAKMVRRSFPKADVLVLDKNYGFVIGNNKGIIYSMKKYNPDYILLLNNDTQIIQREWLKRMVEVAESDKKIGVVGCKMLFPNQKIQWAGRKKEKNIFYLFFQTLSASLNPGTGMDRKESSFVGEVNTVSGACMMIRTSLIKNIGLLDENLSPFLQEDVEYSFRCWKNGYRVYYVGTSNIIHLQSYSFEKRKIPDDKLYLAIRNSMIVSKKYFGLLTVILIGLPIVFLTTILERKNKTKPFWIDNLKLRDNLFRNSLIFLKAVKDILIYKETPIEFISARK